MMMMMMMMMMMSSPQSGNDVSPGGPRESSRVGDHVQYACVHQRGHHPGESGHRSEPAPGPQHAHDRHLEKNTTFSYSA